MSTPVNQLAVGESTLITKVIMQGKLIAVVYTLRSAYILKVETSSLWAEFVNKNRCISVRLISE